MATDISKTWAIGISLGTANTRVAVYRDGQVEIIPDENGNPFIPSYVSFEDQRRFIGTSAKHRATSNPEFTVHGMKRWIGHRLEDAEVQSDTL